jgi:hypothetical protein
MLEILGTALFTDDFGLNNKAHYASRLSWFREEETLALKMAVATI